MKMTLSFQPNLSPAARAKGYEGAMAASAETGATPFADVLQAELASGQRVIRAEQIMAELDGSPDWNFERLIGTYPSKSDGQTSAAPQGIMEKIGKVARSYGVDEALVREVVRAESNFNPHAVSRAGAKGLMQLMDATAKSLKVRDVYNPDENLAGGTKYLRELLDRYDGNVKVALAAYNAGPGRISRLGIDTDDELEERFSQLPVETQRYVDKIMKRLDQDRTS
ncbi:lytic transglycosylase domain-containing protein [Brevibacillus composti]|uniref:Lytic transglycosylase domain-containing protein n=1 Tax=Brevibacillus composti TaxID=2796470 RepID=A0A7T5JM96_9BACL|nr:lytic transglycosylase domain-containing protein [Brevibacillus composti]QQE72765.1 lytic transglycosylase domain-containing protein [Brevibacillus composti]QUO39843.1 lytic transglycosylase domain-containing protein [Brevibacillus composti]